MGITAGVIRTVTPTATAGTARIGALPIGERRTPCITAAAGATTAAATTGAAAVTTVAAAAAAASHVRPVAPADPARSVCRSADRLARAGAREVADGL